MQNPPAQPQGRPPVQIPPQSASPQSLKFNHMLAQALRAVSESKRAAEEQSVLLQRLAGVIDSAGRSRPPCETQVRGIVTVAVREECERHTKSLEKAARPVIIEQAPSLIFPVVIILLLVALIVLVLRGGVPCH